MQPANGPNESYAPDDPPFNDIGGVEGVRALIDAFYDAMDENPAFERIRSLHPDDLTGSRDKLAKFITGWLGGPALYVKEFGHPRLRMRHMPFAIGELERDQWLACMKHAMDVRGIDGRLRAHLDARFAHVADFMRNQAPSSTS